MHGQQNIKEHTANCRHTQRAGSKLTMLEVSSIKINEYSM